MEERLMKKVAACGRAVIIEHDHVIFEYWVHLVSHGLLDADIYRSIEDLLKVKPQGVMDKILINPNYNVDNATLARIAFLFQVSVTQYGPQDIPYH